MVIYLAIYTNISFFYHLYNNKSDFYSYTYRAISLPLYISYPIQCFVYWLPIQCFNALLYTFVVVKTRRNKCPFYPIWEQITILPPYKMSCLRQVPTGSWTVPYYHCWTDVIDYFSHSIKYQCQVKSWMWAKMMMLKTTVCWSWQPTIPQIGKVKHKSPSLVQCRSFNISIFDFCHSSRFVYNS